MNLNRRLVLWGVLTLILQWLSTLLPLTGSVSPQIILLYILYLGLFQDPLVAMISGFLIGLFQDGMTWDPFGLSSLILVLVAYLPHLFRGRLYLKSLVTQLSLLVVITVLAEAVVYTFHLMSGKTLSEEFVYRVSVQVVWNALFWVLLRNLWGLFLPSEELPHRPLRTKSPEAVIR